MACPGIGENIWKNWKEEKISCGIYNKRLHSRSRKLDSRPSMSPWTMNRLEPPTPEPGLTFNNVPWKTGRTLMFAMRFWGACFLTLKSIKYTLRQYQNYLGNYCLKFEFNILNYGKMLEILPNISNACSVSIFFLRHV